MASVTFAVLLEKKFQVRCILCYGEMVDDTVIPQIMTTLTQFTGTMPRTLT